MKKSLILLVLATMVLLGGCGSSGRKDTVDERYPGFFLGGKDYAKNFSPSYSPSEYKGYKPIEYSAQYQDDFRDKQRQQMRDYQIQDSLDKIEKNTRKPLYPNDPWNVFP